VISEKRSQASRINGARSRGPKTPEGKARSSQNAIQHGLLAANILITDECRHNFKALSDLLIQQLNPPMAWNSSSWKI